MFLCLFLMSAHSLAQNSESSTLDEKVDSFLHSMSLEQKVGQMFVFGFSGQSLSSGLKNILTKYEPGSIIIFKRNINSLEQIHDLNHAAQAISFKKSGLPLFVMVDQEGGVVSRIKTRPYAPSALSIGMTENPAISESAGFTTGQILRLLGFNMNLAPVVDISDPSDVNFIGNRSFGGDPNSVSTMTRRFASGLAKAGVLPTFKHFPGHGGAIRDSHKAFAQKLVSLEDLKKNDLIPFTGFNQEYFPSAIMVAHIAFPNIDSSGLPATFSHHLVTDILRKELKYNGLVMTDDIEMFGAKIFKSVGERAIRAIEAGNDLVMVAWTQRKQIEAFNSVLKAVKTGRISSARIDDSLKKIIRSKLILKYEDSEIKKAKLQKVALAESFKKLKETTNVITQRNLERAFYLDPKLKGSVGVEKSIFIFSADGKFYKSFKEVSHNKTLFYPLSPRKTPPVERILNKFKDGVGVYYVTGTGTARLLNRVSNALKERIIVINCTNPGVIANRHLFKGVIDINSRNYSSGGWVASYLQGHDPKLRKPASKSVSQAQ